jgi:hypothetical protein
VAGGGLRRVDLKGKVCASQFEVGAEKSGGKVHVSIGGAKEKSADRSVGATRATAGTLFGVDHV